jgi:Tfp pilus assembly protein PilZ
MGSDRVLSRATTVDLSAHGVGIVANAMPPIGAPVVLDLQLPRGCSLRVEGRVVWVAREATAEQRLRAGIRVVGDELASIVRELGNPQRRSIWRSI